MTTDLSNLSPNDAAPPPSLTLRYTCTTIEVGEADSLVLRQELGGGSGVLTAVALVLLLAGVGVEFWLMTRTGATGWIHWVAILGIVLTMFFTKNRFARRRSRDPMAVEITADGIHSGRGGALAFTPWRAFARGLESKTLFVFESRGDAPLTIIPKRVLPDASWIAWIREASAAAGSDEPGSNGAGQLTAAIESPIVQGKLNYLDLVDIAAATWMVRALMVGEVALLIWVPLTLTLHRPAGAQHGSMTLLVVMIPLALMLTTVIPAFYAARAWISQRQRRMAHEIQLDESGITVSSSAGMFHWAWTADVEYKQTFRTLLLWRCTGNDWIAVPKRMFATPAALDACRALCARRAMRSTWFMRM